MRPPKQPDTKGRFWIRLPVLWTVLIGFAAVTAALTAAIYWDELARSIDAAPRDRSLLLAFVAACGLVAILSYMRLYQLGVRAIDTERRQTERLSLVAKVSSDIAHEDDFEGVLDALALAARQAIGAHQAFAAVRIGNDPPETATASSFSDRYRNWRGYRPSLERGGIFRFVFEQNRPVRVSRQSTRQHPMWMGTGRPQDRTSGRDDHPPIDGWLAAPILTPEGANIGIIHVADKFEGEFDTDDEAILVQLVQIASVAIENLKAYRRIKEALVLTEASREETDRQRAQAEAARSEADTARAEVERVLNSMSDGVCIVDRRFLFRYVNPPGRRILGLEDVTATGASFFDVFPGAKEPSIVLRLRGVLEQGTPFETELASRDRLYELRAFPSDNAASIFFRDVTDQRKIEDHLRQSQKLEAIGQLTGGIAHDFNNLLTVILGNTGMIAKRLPDDSPIAPLVSMTRKAAERAADLTSRLLAFGRRQSLQPDVCDIGLLVEEMRELIQRSIGERHPLEVDVPAEKLMAKIDRSQLESAILNLAINSRDAMPGGGAVRISVGRVVVAEGEKLADIDIAAGRHVLITVRDSGTGMSEEVKARALEPFFTTKEVGRGTGLGLSMVYGFVKQSGGQLAIASAPGKGTTISIYLPEEVVIQARSLKLTLPMRDLDVVGRHILVVEDNEMVASHVRAQLESLGYRVSMTFNGEDALDLLKRTRDVDLVFTDVVMPGAVNGVELARQIRRRWPAIKVLLTSGYAQKIPIGERSLEGVELLLKPYDESALASKIQASLAS